MNARRHTLSILFAVTASCASAPQAVAQGADAGSLDRIVIHDAAETLRDFCERDADGVLWLEIPGRGRYALVESTDDPAISNPGDGAFHPFDEIQVRAALAEVRYPLEAVRAQVFLLPFPRRNGLESAAAPGLIMLAPGVREPSAAQQHAEFVHELGHVVQYALMPDAERDDWTSYRRLRHIQDETRFSASSVHADRPHEIFAEDFRALFGGASANYSRTIENATLTYPTAVPGLSDFFLSLDASPLGGIALRSVANPSRAWVRLESDRLDAGPVDIVDVAGRRLATLEAVRWGGSVEWVWDRLDRSGVRVGAGVVFARARGDRGASTRIVLAP